MKLLILLSVLVVGIGSSIYANNDPKTKKAIVLINGEAYLVELSPQGDIKATYQKISNYFNSSESHFSIIKRLSQNESLPSSEIAFYQAESEPAVPYTAENLSTLSSEAQRYIGFSPWKAVLNFNAVNQLREIAAANKNGVLNTVLVDAYHINSYRSKTLARNRALAIKSLLVAFGVSEDHIITDIIQISPESKVDFVRITFR